MGGGGGGGGFSSSDMAKMQEAAEARLRAIASKSTKILFVCENIDKQSLESHVAQSKAFPKNRTTVLDATQATKVDAQLESATFLVVFTDQTKSTAFIDSVIDKALLKKMSGVHVKAQAKSLVPSKVTAYRWRSITWKELEAIFSA
jgi:PleD family two-component response regulator